MTANQMKSTLVTVFPLLVLGIWIIIASAGTGLISTAASQDDARARIYRYFSAKGFSDAQIGTVIELTYVAVGDRSDDEIVTYARTSFGGLEVRSQPAGAAISVDDKRWGTTNRRDVTRSGERHIRLKKDGYIEEEGVCEVEGGEWCTFDKKLRKK